MQSKTNAACVPASITRSGTCVAFVLFVLMWGACHGCDRATVPTADNEDPSIANHKRDPAATDAQAEPPTTTPGNTTPGNTTSGNTTSGNTTPGNTTPGTELAEQDLATTLAQTKARWVVIQVFAESCGPCLTEALQLNERLQDWQERGIAVLGLSMDVAPESVATFYQQTGRRITFPLYLAPWFAEQQDVALTPTLFIYDQAGKQLFRADGESHPENVLGAVEAKLAELE